MNPSRSLGLSLIVGLLVSTPAAGVSTSDTRMLAEPAVSAEHLAFTYAGDLWIADRGGDNPRRHVRVNAEGDATFLDVRAGDVDLDGIDR